MFQILGIILSVILGGAATICSSMVLFNLRSMSKRIDKVETAQAAMGDRLVTCKQDCDRNTVSKEDWVRSEGYTRRAIDKVSQQLAAMDGRWSIADRLPEICSRVARETAKELKGVKQ